MTNKLGEIKVLIVLLKDSHYPAWVGATIIRHGNSGSQTKLF